MTCQAALQLSRGDDEAEPIRATAQPAGKDYEATIAERERRTATATLGIGSPVSVSPQPPAAAPSQARRPVRRE